MPPLEPLAVRRISPRFPVRGRAGPDRRPGQPGLGPTAIGRELGRAASTISRELRLDPA
ncbi:helix-turn-helix domain-containing protein [Nocardioides sp. TRM66260-LWL]|nr:helix-turn-helix domain-containing protein [Nocardioides sp. TRM66260-LWL]